VDQAAESVSAQNAHTGHFDRRMRTPGGRVLLQRPVRAMRVVVVGVLAEDQPRVPFAGDQHPVQALAAGAALYRFKTHRRVSDLRIHEISYAVSARRVFAHV